MHRTILDTPILTALLRPLAGLLLGLSGWRIVGGAPEAKRVVLVAAPHTSNLDAFLLLMMAAKLRIKLFWLGKDSLFRWPFGWLSRWLGGIPVDRSRSTNLVSSVAALLREASELILVVSPEGTRARSEGWKSGFYHIALEAGVPLSLGYLDWARRMGGVGPLFHPSGSFEIDLPRIRAFYADKVGRYPDAFGEVRLKEEM